MLSANQTEPHKRMTKFRKQLLTSVAAVGFAAVIAIAPGIPAGSGTIGVTEEEMKAVRHGWSAKKNILGKPVYNDDKEKIGVIDDLVITPQRLVPYAIIGVGGLLGIGKHEVAIAMSQLKEEQGQFFAPRATRYAIRAMPRFEYAKQ
jgi:PRC-barrel domain